jgi:hypothetical protein
LYNGRHTDPTSQFAAAKKGNKINPQEVSPANVDTSIYVMEQECHPEGGVAKARRVKVNLEKHLQKGSERVKQIQEMSVKVTKAADRRATHADDRDV